MNIFNFYKSLNTKEKTELAELLREEGFISFADSILIPKWIEEHTNQLPERIKTVLMEMYNFEGYNFINQITKKSFLCHRNIGLKSWQEFERIRGLI